MGKPVAEPIRIANCSGFYGDRLSAAAEMVNDGPIDVLTGDWLAELTMLILARTRSRLSGGGYARTFVNQMEQVMGTCMDSGIKVVSNAGGLDPGGCAAAVAEVAERLGLSPRIAYVDGDDLMGRINPAEPPAAGAPVTATWNADATGIGTITSSQQARRVRSATWNDDATGAGTITPSGTSKPPNSMSTRHGNSRGVGPVTPGANSAGAEAVAAGDVAAEAAGVVDPVTLRCFTTGEPLPDISGLITANAYLGGWGIAEALRRGADIVVTGRVTDAAVVCGPAAWHHGWASDDWDALAGAVVAGHVIECGTQATGGNYSFFTEIGGMDRTGFPWAEIAADGSSLIGKHDGTGGAVTVGTVTSQLLYEIDSPMYRGPDVTARFDTICLEQTEPDRVQITSVKGQPPPATLKVAANEVGGFRSEITVALTGLDIDAKAALVHDAFWRACPHSPDDYSKVIERVMRTDKADPATNEEAAALWRLTVFDDSEERLGRTLRDAMNELALATIPGLYSPGSASRPRSYGIYRPAVVPADLVPQYVNFLDGERTVVDPLPVLKDRSRVPTNDTTNITTGWPPPPAPNETTTPAPGEPQARTAGQPSLAPNETTAPAPGEPQARTAGQPSPAPNEDTTPAPEHANVTTDALGTDHQRQWGSVRAVPLGRLFGTRSGDKGGNANLGVFARSADAFVWLDGFLTVEQLKKLLPEAAPMVVERYRLANIWSLNFVLHGLLGAGVAASDRQDPQAKSLGEWLRARVVNIPTELLD